MQLDEIGDLFTVPGGDASVSATAWAGTWLLAKRKIENWMPRHKTQNV
ncbi:MAG TPA: hypothetical protein VNU72_10710 [Puia sp.]|nr:hypothetical protein [Puia sp.]